MNTQSLNTAVIHPLRRTICAVAAATVTFGIFSGVVSLADDAPMAIAGQSTAKTMASNRHADTPVRVATAPAARHAPQVR